MAKETRTIMGLEIFETGTWNGDVYNLQDLKDMISAAENVGFEAPLKLGHMEDEDTKALLKKEGMPAFGWITNLRIKGTKLIADVTDIPRKIAELIENKAYKRVSAEIYWNFKKGQDTYRRVLKAVSLLGAEIPAITDLKAIEALYERLEIQAKAYDDDGNEYRTYFFGGEGGLQLKFKDTVNYRLAEGSLERCGACRFYLGNPEALAIGSCTLVHGEIAADAICDLYEAREAFQFPGGVGVTDGVATTAAEFDDGEAITSAEFDEFEFADAEDDAGIAILSGKLKDGKFARHKIRFKKSQWKVADAKAWLKAKGMRFGSLHETAGYLNFLQRKEEEFDGGFKRILIKNKKPKKNDKPYTIEKRGDEYCLIADDGKVLGCHPTMDDAEAQERAVQANKSADKSIELSVEDVRQMCPECAEDMEKASAKTLTVEVDEEDFDGKEYQGNVGALIRWVGRVGFRNCVRAVAGKPGITDAKKLCGWLKARARGASFIGSDIHVTSKGQSAQGQGEMTEKKIEELEAQVTQLTQDVAGLTKENSRLKTANEDAKNYSSMILDQKVEIETLHSRLDDITRAQKEEKIVAFVAEQIRVGKVLPREKQTMVAMLREASDEIKTVYSEEGKEVKLSQRQLIMQNLKNRPQMVHYGEHTVSTATFDDGEPGEVGTKDARDEVHEKVKAFQAQHNEPDYKVALDRVLGADRGLMERYAKSAGWGQ